MKNIEISELDRLTRMFAALGNRHRLGIFQRLSQAGVERCRGADTELCVCDVAAGTGLSMSTVSHHLKELREARLVVCEKRGQSVYCTVDPQALKLIERFAGAALTPHRQGRRQVA